MGYTISPWRAFELMKASEKHGGHPCTRHIGLSNAELMKRLYEDGRNGEITYISTFSTAKDAAQAAHETFKNLDSQKFSAFFRGSKTKEEFPDVRVDRAFKARFAFGSGPRELSCNHVTLVLFRPGGIDGTLFFVKTFYPRPPNELRLEPLRGNV
jgi:hypothetical protein